MSMMEVGNVRMAVLERLVDVHVSVRLAGRVVGRVCMPVVLVVRMPMLVFDRGVDVQVIVTLP